MYKTISQKILTIVSIVFLLSPLVLLSSESDFESAPQKKYFDSLTFYTNYFSIDNKDINKIASDFGFNTFNPKGRYLLGINVNFTNSNDYVVGIDIAYNYSVQKINYLMLDESNFISNRELRYRIGYAGVNIGKRFLLPTTMFYAIPGLFIGYGEHRINVASSDSYLVYNWNNLDYGLELDTFSTVTFLKHYTIFQPKCEINYILSNSFLLAFELGYVFSFSNIDWKNLNIFSSQTIIDAPNTKFQGLTIKLGPKIMF